MARYENQALGVQLFHPGWWENVPLDAPGQWLQLEDGESSARLTLLTMFGDPTMTLNERLRAAITRLTPEDVIPEVTFHGPITLTDGGQAERADILYYEGDDGPALRRIQVAQRGSFTFVLALSVLYADLERWQHDFNVMLSSFTSFPPAPYGIARDKAFTMPLGEPRTMDPAIAREVTSHLFVSSVFSGLVRLNPDLSISPDLAESWEVDEAGVVYTFTLREGITFHDGRPITAADFKYSIERASAPALHSDTVPLYLSDVVGMHERLEGGAREVAGVEAVDDRTLRITIDAPKEYFLAKLAYPCSAVVDRHEVEAQGDDWWMDREVNGSGPYRLMLWDPDRVTILQRFDGYHAPVVLEHLISPRVTLPGARALQMYQTDAWDALTVSLGSVDSVREDPLLSEEMRQYDELNVYFVVMDAARPPFDDPKVRRAFAMALDRQRFIEEIYDGNVKLANGLLPPGLPGYTESLRGIAFNPEEARQLLAESRYADDFPEIVYAAVDLLGQPPQSVQFMLKAWQDELGIEVKTELLESDEFYYHLEESEANLFTYGWVADYPDPENFLDLLLHSDSHNGRYKNPEFDDIVERARVERDIETRLGLYREAEQLLLDDAGIIPLFHSQDFVLVRPHVNGFALLPVGQPHIADITLDPIAR